MMKAARKAAYGLSKDFREVENLQVSLKGPGDFVSQADIKAEKTLRGALEKARPGYSFLMEEAGLIDRQSDHRWIIDPIDGTKSFICGVPMYAVLIGVEIEGEGAAGENNFP